MDLLLVLYLVIGVVSSINGSWDLIITKCDFELIRYPIIELTLYFGGMRTNI